MTTVRPEYDIESIPVLNLDDDGFDHWICPVCYPGFVPGKIVKALCGKLGEDCPPGQEPLPGSEECERCSESDFCPICGSEQ